MFFGNFNPNYDTNFRKEYYDKSKLLDDTYEMVVQVNGKVRGKLVVSTDTSEEDMKSLAQTIDNVKTFIDGKEIVKIIVIAKKLVNIVVK